jgi:arabinofuranan 3-O-arabinosyltransferase
VRAPARARSTRLPLLVLAALVYLPLLATAPGRVGADTKSYLYLEPSRLLSRAWSMWDPSIGLGTVSHQNIGYLWPMGPWYWAFDRLGIPDWIAQRLWLGTIIYGAGAGTYWLLRRVFGWRTTPAAIAAFSYGLTPYVLTLAARLSGLLLPFMGLPWMLGLTVLAVRRGRWREPALFALLIATIGSVNATALLLAGLAPLWWLVHAFLAREATPRQLVTAVGRIGVLTVAANLWWIAGLWAQSGWGIEILRYTETAEVVTTASNAAEILRGFGYWFFYGGDRLGSWIEPARGYTQSLRLLVLTYGLPFAALVAALRVRHRQRSFFVGLLAIGLIASMGAYPWDDPPPFGRAVKAFLLSDLGLAMRSLPRATPLVALAMAASLGAGVDAAARWLQGRPRPALSRLGIALPALTVVAIYGAMSPLWLGQMVATNLDRDEDIPDYWLEAAGYLDSRGQSSRVLEVPGVDFASYRWGNTVDPITPGLIDRPYVARELIPYGSPASAELLAALDLRFQEGTLEQDMVAPLARLLGAGDVVLRDDMQFERYRTPRPYVLSPALAAQLGLDDPVGFGEPAINRPVDEVPLQDELALARDDQLPRPPVEVFAVEEPEAIIRTRPTGAGVVVAADGNGLVDAAAAGLIDGHRLVRYAADLGAEGVAAALAEGDTLVITDGNRLQGRRWSTVRDNLGMVEPPALLDTDDLTDNRLPVFPEAEDGWHTTNLSGDVEVTGTSYGNDVTFTAEYRPANAVDGDVTTEWRTGAGADVRGQELRIRPQGGSTATALRLVQQISGFQNRFIQEIEIRRDDLPPQRVVLDESSQSPEGQLVQLDPPAGRFETLTVEIVRDDSGMVPRWGRPVRWLAMTQVGFAEVELLEAGGDPTGQYADSALQLPPAATAAIDGTSDVALVLSRWRVDPSDPVRLDPERQLLREWDQPVDRTWELSARARIDAHATAEVIDQVLGTTGPVVSSQDSLVGFPEHRATAAVDGDPATGWISGYFHDDPSLTVLAPAPTTIESLAPVLVDDDRLSTVTELTIEVDGTTAGSFPVEGDGSTITLPEPVTGTSFRFTVSDIDAERTREWYGNVIVEVPVGIAELGIPELEVTVPDRIDTGCRDDLLQIDGQAVPLRVAADTEAFLRAEAIDAEVCDGAVDLDAGRHRLESADGPRTGLGIDLLTLRSGFAGLAGGSSVPASPTVSVTDDGRWRSSVRIDGAVPGEPFWLVLGQSDSTGWALEGEGVADAERVRVDGYANGWVIEPTSSTMELSIVWTPQRTVNRALVVSLFGCLGCIALAAWSGRRQPIQVTRLVARTAGSPTTRWRASIIAAGFAGSLLFIGPIAAVVVTAITALAAWLPGRHRRWVWLLPLAGYGAGIGYILSKQVWKAPGAAFEWPAEQEAAHQVALVTVALLLTMTALQARLEPPGPGDETVGPDDPLPTTQ